MACGCLLLLDLIQLDIEQTTSAEEETIVFSETTVPVLDQESDVAGDVRQRGEPAFLIEVDPILEISQMSLQAVENGPIIKTLSPIVGGVFTRAVSERRPCISVKRRRHQRQQYLPVVVAQCSRRTLRAIVF